jgi:membrane protease YdiL (CAAX protease family)
VITHPANVANPSVDIDPSGEPDDIASAANPLDPPPLARPVLAALATDAAWSIPDRLAIGESVAADDPMLLHEVSRSVCALDLLLFGIYMTGYQVGAAFLSGLLLSGDSSLDRRVLIVALTLGGGALSLVVVGLLNHLHGVRPSSLGLTNSHLGLNVLLGLATTIATFAVFYLALLSVGLLWPAGFEALRDNPDRIARSLPRMNIPTFAGLAMAVGLYEEFVFRGFLFTRLRRLTHSWAAAALFGSLVFTLLHLEMQAAATAVPLFCMAVLWCGVTWWRRSLVPVILGHTLFDFIQLVSMAVQNPDWK